MKLPGILSIDDQIKYIEKLPVCEETKAVLNSLEVAKSHVSQFPEKSIGIALTTDKAKSWNHWDIERHKLLDSHRDEIMERNEIIQQKNYTISTLIKANKMLSDKVKELENLLNERAQKHNAEIERLNVSNLELRDKIKELKSKLIDISQPND